MTSEELEDNNEWHETLLRVRYAERTRWALSITLIILFGSRSDARNFAGRVVSRTATWKKAKTPFWWLLKVIAAIRPLPFMMMFWSCVPTLPNCVAGHCAS